ncbi:MAG: hypothetical protein ABR548_01505 [Actinomycetota bacterium]
MGEVVLKTLPEAILQDHLAASELTLTRLRLLDAEQRKCSRDELSILRTKAKHQWKVAKERWRIREAVAVRETFDFAFTEDDCGDEAAGILVQECVFDLLQIELKIPKKFWPEQFVVASVDVHNELWRRFHWSREQIDPPVVHAWNLDYLEISATFLNFWLPEFNHPVEQTKRLIRSAARKKE